MRSEPEELKFGNFKILRRETGELWELGRGGFGTTYKAEHEHLKRDCALKVINDSRVASEDARLRFLQEARAAASLLHPHIAAVYDFGEADGVFYYAMEYCAGGDLERYVEREGALSWAEVEPLAIQIASALSRAHQSGLLHRDLKPSNIMLSAENQKETQLKLIDFGLVKVIDHEKSSSTQLMMTQEGAAGFNPLTASPEQLRDEDLDERSDLFSFGITLLYLLCGGVPFGNVSAPLMMAQRLDDESYDSILPSDLTGVGREVISRLIQKDREQRYRSADEVLNALQTPAHAGSVPVGGAVAIVAQGDIEAVSMETAQEVDWTSAWEVTQIQQKCHSGTYYRCRGRQQGIPDVVMFMPSSDAAQAETILFYADKLVNADTQVLLSFTDAGHMDGERAYLCQPFMGKGGRLIQLLQAKGNFNLQTHLLLFQQMAKAIDEASEIGLPGLELNASAILVDDGEIDGGGIPASSDEWLDYYKEKIANDSSYVGGVRLSVLPKLEEPADEDDIQATVTLEDLATDPMVKFGSLIYRSISGMSVRPAAYLRESGYVSTSNLSEESNRLLAEIIACRSGVSSAEEIVAKLCDFEGCALDVELIETHLATRRDASKHFTKSLANVGPLLADAVTAKQRTAQDREERERLQAKEREEKRVAEEEALQRAREKEEKQREARKAAESKQREQADKERKKLEAENLKGNEAKRKVEEGERNLAAQKKEADRLHEEALTAQKRSEQEANKIAKETKQPSQQQQGETTGAGNKKKPIVIAVAAVILGLLVFVGIKSFSADRDKGGVPNSKLSDVDGGMGNANTKDSAVEGSGIKDPGATKLVAVRTSCVIIIPLSDGGKGIPNDVEMELVTSDGGGYGALTKSSGGLKATLTGERPPKDEKFKVKFKNKNYTLESDVKFRSDQFEEAEPGVYSYKLNVQLNARAQFDIVPSLKPRLAQYKKPLLELLKTRGQLKILNEAGSEIKEAKAFYDKSSEKIRIVMPVGRSFDAGNVKLKIDWPYFESLNLEIGNNGLVDNKSWEIKLKKYDLNLSLLKDRMPRFETVGFIPTFGDAIEAGLKEAIKALLESEQVSYLKNYKDIKGDNDVLAVPSQEGSLVFSGGVIQDEGILIKRGVKRGQLASSFSGFPKGLYVAALPIPFRNNNPQEKGGGYIYTAIPSMVAIHLQDTQEGVTHPFEFRVMIEENLEMKQYLTTVKLKSWNQRTNQWTLTSVTGEQQALNLILIVSRASDGSLSVDYTDIVVNGENKYKFDPVAKTKWGMSIEPKEGGFIHQKLTMKFISRSEDAKSFIQNLESNYALSRKDFEGLKDRYNTPENYPAFTKSIFRKLGE